MHMCKWMFYEFSTSGGICSFAPRSQVLWPSVLLLLFNNPNWFLQSVHGWLTPSIFLERYRAWAYPRVTRWSLVLGWTSVPPILLLCLRGPRDSTLAREACSGEEADSGSQVYLSVQRVSLLLPSHVSSCADEWDATFKQNMGAQFVRIAKNASGNMC